MQMMIFLTCTHETIQSTPYSPARTREAGSGSLRTRWHHMAPPTLRMTPHATH